MIKKLLFFVYFLLVFCISILAVFSQERVPLPPDSLIHTNELKLDTLSSDTIRAEDENEIKTPITYTAEDSIEISMDGQKVYLYGNAKIIYENIELTAEHIELDLEKKEVFAIGIPDSLGKEVGKPVFKEGSETFNARTLRYNFKTKKGYIEDVIKEEESGGFMHGTQTKKQANNHIHMKKGKYTTCNQEHPHFYVAMTKAKVIPNDKIITGPSYLVIEDVPIYFPTIPFGFFPNKKGRASGILIPTYGEENARGFYLRNGGFYWGISDMMDFAIRGDIYSKGTWGFITNYNFVKRYKFKSNLDFRYYENVTSEKELPDYSKSKDFSIKWSHSQDAKANPYGTFNANVNFSTSSFDKNHSERHEDYLNNTKQSSISYSRNIPNSPFRYTMNLRHSQNSKNHTANFTLPQMSFNMDQQFPFQKKNAIGEKEWYENIQVKYSANLQNDIKTNDSTFFKNLSQSDFNNGFKHEIPLSTNIKTLKYLTITPQIKYNGVLYTSCIEKSWDEENNQVIKDTIYGLKYAHSYSPSIGFSLAPKLFVMLFPKNPNSKIIAVRHAMSPSIGLSFQPDMRDFVPDYYKELEYQNNQGETVKQSYSVFEGYRYGTPTMRGKSGAISFSLDNNFEMKVKSDNDTIEDHKKIRLLESLKFNTSYNIYADSLNWSQISITGRTKVFNEKLSLNFSGTLDPYAINTNGTRINTSYWKTNRKIGRLTKANLGIKFSLSSKSGEKDNINEEVQDEVSFGSIDDYNFGAGYVNFDIPWELDVNYTFNYSKPAFEKKITQSLKLTGNFSLTPKLKISFNSGYDFKAKEITPNTRISIHRDLHCWEASLNWVPIGSRATYNFMIKVKSSILQDLKWKKSKSWYDKDL